MVQRSALPERVERVAIEIVSTGEGEELQIVFMLFFWESIQYLFGVLYFQKRMN